MLVPCDRSIWRQRQVYNRGREQTYHGGGYSAGYDCTGAGHGVHSYPSPIGVDALGNQARSSVCGSGEVPNGRKADQSAGKTANQNVEGVAVGGIHEILHPEWM